MRENTSASMPARASALRTRAARRSWSSTTAMRFMRSAGSGGDRRQRSEAVNIPQAHRCLCGPVDQRAVFHGLAEAGGTDVEEDAVVRRDAVIGAQAQLVVSG